MGIHEAPTAQLPDGVGVPDRGEHPSLRVVVLSRSRDDGEVGPRILVGIDETRFAQLLDRIRAEMFLDGEEHPSLRVVVLGGPGNCREVARLMRIDEPVVALLLDGCCIEFRAPVSLNRLSPPEMNATA